LAHGDSNHIRERYVSVFSEKGEIIRDVAAYSRISRLIRCLLAIPIAVTITRSDRAVRPCLPITFPISPGSTEIRRVLPSFAGTDSTLTPSGWSTISLINVVIASAMSFDCSMTKNPNSGQNPRPDLNPRASPKPIGLKWRDTRNLNHFVQSARSLLYCIGRCIITASKLCPLYVDLVAYQQCNCDHTGSNLQIVVSCTSSRV
jgi:hypothetical protein